MKPKPKSPSETEEGVFGVAAEELSKKLPADDLQYVKDSVGPAIRKALAAVVLDQPADPINYFAHFLLNYRYNQHMFEKRDEELNYYLELRKHLNDGGGGDDCQ